jgi:hypothetical protein
MVIWQIDFYRRPLQDGSGHPLWELLVCDRAGDFRHQAFCPQPEAGAGWLRGQLQILTEKNGIPERVQVFRPQALSLVETACQPLGISVEAIRRVPELKHWLEQRAQEYRTLPNYTGQAYQPLGIEKPPPMPLPENLWGDRWGFASFPAGDLMEAFADRPIPFGTMPPELSPFNLGIASGTLVPGVIITGGRRALQLSRWLQEAIPVSLTYVPGAPDGLVLEAGLNDRWIVATFEDGEMKAAGQTYQQRQKTSRGLHFLLVQPDDSGMTHSGFWLLQVEDLSPN